MEHKIKNFIIKYFGCYTIIEGEKLLTSLGTDSLVPIPEFWNVFSGDAYCYFRISKSLDSTKLSLRLNEGIRRRLEFGLNLKSGENYCF